LLDSWLPFLIYGFFALAIPSSMIFASFALATKPHRRVRGRPLPFESGVSDGPPVHSRFTISFYLTAMLFIVFDIELAFLYPIAVTLRDDGVLGLVVLLVFVFTVVEALTYVWKKGALEWR